MAASYETEDLQWFGSATSSSTEEIIRRPAFGASTERLSGHSEGRSSNDRTWALPPLACCWTMSATSLHWLLVSSLPAAASGRTPMRA